MPVSLREELARLLAEMPEEDLEVLHLTALNLLSARRGGGGEPLNGFVGIRAMRVEGPRCQGEMVSGPQNRTPWGSVHAGALFTFAEVTIGCGIGHFTGKPVMPVDLKINYVRPALAGRLYSEATVIHAGNRLATSQCLIRDEGGQPVAAVQGSFYLVNR